MPLEIKSTEQFVADEIAAINAQLPGSFQFPVGSYTRATVEAHARIGIWQESNIELVFSSIRLATSIGTAVDTFLADYGLSRLPAVSASGDITFSSNTFTSDRFVNVGQTVSQINNICSYAVVADSTNSNFDPDTQQYKIPAGTQSLPFPVLAVTPGIIGNCVAGAINVINSPIVGIDTVTNIVEFSNGVDAQTDPQARAYFLTYINSLSRATESAWDFAVESVDGVKEFTVQENVNYPSLSIDLGRGFAVVDDGTGTPNPTLIAKVLASVALYRGLAIRFDVYGPVPITINITATLTIPAGYTNPGFSTIITTALQVYLQAIPFGGTVFYSQVLYQIYNAIVNSSSNFITNPSLIDGFNVSNLLVNGATADVTTTVIQKTVPGTITISVV